MNEFSILIGGKAGDGIDKASTAVANILNRLGYYIYIYRDYPSIIRGGHTFSIVRASKDKVFTHTDDVDVILALNKDTIEMHANRLKPASVIVHGPKVTGEALDSLEKNQASLVLPVETIVKEEDAPKITSNSVMIGSLVKILGISWSVLEAVFKEKLRKATDKNIAVAKRGFDEAKNIFKVEDLNLGSRPLLNGNEALGLGLVKGGLQTYIAYPMTPTSNLLKFMAENADGFKLKVIHPESEIGAVLMAIGCAYTGERVAVGTSGGGFCLMNEGFSFSAMSEVPVVVIVGQRPGPSTGLPTYSSQTELHFALHAGQGEFTRLVVAPGDAEEACYWSQITVTMSTKYRIPAIILTDKNLGEGVFSFDEKSQKPLIAPKLTGVGEKRVFKASSYEHDENGITTENGDISTKMQNMRLAKVKDLSADLDKYESVGIYGNKNSTVAILCWGSNKGVCIEAANKLGLKVIQPKVMSPFPVNRFKGALKGIEYLIAVENNATGQLVKLINQHGFDVDDFILKYDGRPFSINEMEKELNKTISKGKEYDTKRA